MEQLLLSTVSSFGFLFLPQYEKICFFWVIYNNFICYCLFVFRYWDMMDI